MTAQQLMFNWSLKRSVVPGQWKETNITPLFKKDFRSKSDDYRSISLTSAKH